MMIADYPNSRKCSVDKEKKRSTDNVSPLTDNNCSHYEYSDYHIKVAVHGSTRDASEQEEPWSRVDALAKRQGQHTNVV